MYIQLGELPQFFFNVLDQQLRKPSDVGAPSFPLRFRKKRGEN